jgi:hypothetical protein
MLSTQRLSVDFYTALQNDISAGLERAGLDASAEIVRVHGGSAAEAGG